jgi:hypothetical protein
MWNEAVVARLGGTRETHEIRMLYICESRHESRTSHSRSRSATYRLHVRSKTAG